MLKERKCVCLEVGICVCVCDRQSQMSRQMFPLSLVRLSEKDWQQLDQCQTHMYPCTCMCAHTPARTNNDTYLLQQNCTKTYVCFCIVCYFCSNHQLLKFVSVDHSRLYIPLWASDWFWLHQTFSGTWRFVKLLRIYFISAWAQPKIWFNIHWWKSYN